MKARKILFSSAIVVLFLTAFIITPFVSLLVYIFDFRTGNNLGNYFLTELITVLFFGVLLYCYKKSKNIRKRFLILSITVGVLISLIVMYGFLLFFFLHISMDFTERAREAEKNFSVNQDQFIPLMTTIFDKAEKTNVRADIDIKYGHLLGKDVSCLESINRESKVCYAGMRRPVYFIRLKEDKIQKLFQSGNIKTEVIDIDGERIVRDMLLGKRDPIKFPQHTCCGYDDLSWNEVPFFRFFVKETRYLKDFYSELETIFLIRDRDGNIIGAMVDLHGD